MEYYFHIFFLVIMLLIASYQLFRVNKKNRGVIGTCSGALFAFIMYYCVVPIVVLSVKGVPSNNNYVSTILNSKWNEYVLTYVSMLVFLSVFIITYKRNNKTMSSVFYIFNEIRWLKITKAMTLLTFFIGGITFLIYIYAFGGVRNLFNYAEYLRSFASSGTDVVSYLASIMVIPARLITVTPILSITLCSKHIHNNIFYRIIFIISFLLTVIFNIANAGRTSVILFALIFLVPFIAKVFKHPWTLAIMVGLFSFPVLGLLDSFFKYISGMGWDYERVETINYLPQFSYPFSNVLNMKNITDQSGFRWGQDFITGVLNIIPGINFQPSTEPTCYYYGGSTWRITGGTPNDIITFGYLQFGIIGIALMAFLLGKFLGKADRMLKTFKPTYAYDVVSASVIVNSFAYIINADIVTLVRSQFQFTLVMICILYANKKISVKL